MGTPEEIIAARRYGRVRCGFSPLSRPSVSELAAQFGLATDAAKYHPIDRSGARRLVAKLLHRDLAYGEEIMSMDRAVALADAFLTSFDEPSVEYYTNGHFYEDRPTTGWSPVTSSTFDTGVLIVGSSRSGCFWVEDED